jgi:hypothetical protein
MKLFSAKTAHHLIAATEAISAHHQASGASAKAMDSPARLHHSSPPSCGVVRREASVPELASLDRLATPLQEEEMQPSKPREGYLPPTQQSPISVMTRTASRREPTLPSPRLELTESSEFEQYIMHQLHRLAAAELARQRGEFCEQGTEEEEERGEETLPPKKRRRTG